MDGSHRASVAIINNDLIKTGNFDVQVKIMQITPFSK